MKRFLGLTILGLTLASEASVLNGAGSSLAMPLYSRWSAEYTAKAPQTHINYNSVGSGAGIRLFLAKTVDFGATDAPMKDDEIKLAATGVLHIPVALAAVVVTYNVPGLKEPLKLDASTIRKIYLGEIKVWSDPEIIKLNPQANLPKLAILPVYRADGSGTTAIFSDYLSKADEIWSKKLGSGKALNWASGIGGKGNEGVSSAVKSTPGAVGYVESTYAVESKLPSALIKNAAGDFVAGDLKGISEAAAGVTFPKDFRTSIVFSKGKNAYPISGLTYALLYTQIPKDKFQELVDFFTWSLNDGQKLAPKLGFAPLPEKLRGSVLASLHKITATP